MNIMELLLESTNENTVLEYELENNTEFIRIINEN